MFLCCIHVYVGLINYMYVYISLRFPPRTIQKIPRGGTTGTPTYLRACTVCEAWVTYIELRMTLVSTVSSSRTIFVKFTIKFLASIVKNLAV